MCDDRPDDHHGPTWMEEHVSEDHKVVKSTGKWFQRFDGTNACMSFRWGSI